MTRTVRRDAIAFVLIFSLALPCAYAGGLKKGAFFSDARAQLVKQGWRPVDTHTGEAFEPIGLESELLAAQILEVESCAVDRPLCIFNYKRDKRCLRVITTGEELSELRVQSWSSTCPNP